MSSKLPLELWDIVIDSLWDDLPALSACSLACCAWLPTTRLHKLHTVALRTPERCRWLESFLESPLVDSANIPSYVRELRVGADPNDKRYDRSEVSSIWDDPRLVSLLCKFSRAESLQLYHLRWTLGPFFPEAARRFMAGFPQLKRLVMKVAVFHSQEDLLLLLSSFPRLESVTMAFVSWYNQDVVTRWTTSPRRPLKQSDEPIILSLNNFKTDPTSYIAVITAASVSQNTWRLALGELEWVGHEKFTSDWMLARAYEQSTAFINPLSDITAHLLAVEGRGLLESQPSLVSSLNSLHIDITTMPGPQAWTSVRAIPFSTLDIREIRYTLGTIRACSVFTELGERLAWMFLDRYLTGLLADLPRLVPKFYLDIDFNGELADYAGCMAVVEDSFNHNLSTLLESGARVCAIITYPGANAAGSDAYCQELWWPKPFMSGALTSV